MLKGKIYEEIVNSFSTSYDWLGRQFGEEFMASVASSNIQTFSNPNFRIRRHLLLFWSASWIKTTMLKKGYELLGDKLCTIMSDISLATLRGTVESNQFVSPFTLKRPFSVCTEFGQVISGNDTELIQKLLNILEEGIVTVSLGKIAYLNETQRIQAQEDYGITFLDKNTFVYKTNWVLMAGTYNKRFLVDNALESRFNIVYPEKKLDSSLTKHIVNAPPFNVSEEAIEGLRKCVFENVMLDLAGIKLPSEIYDTCPDLSPRQCAGLISYIACRSFWNQKTTKEDVLNKLREMNERSEMIWKTADDRVFDSIQLDAKTAQEIADELDISKRQVYFSLRSIRATRIIDEEGEAKWKML